MEEKLHIPTDEARSQISKLDRVKRRIEPLENFSQDGTSEL
jgi:hypothetical protein